MLGRLAFATVVLLSSPCLANDMSFSIGGAANAARSAAAAADDLVASWQARSAPLQLAASDIQPQSQPDQGDEPAAPPQADTPSLWHATAYGLWRDRKGLAHVAVGYSGTADSADSASASALQACKKASGGNTCKLIGPYNNGCLYITSGSSRRGVSYGNAATPEDALKSCQSQGKGYKCQKPIGGCLE